METLKLMAQRHSCRAYTDQQLSADQVQTILKAGGHAPVGRALYETLHFTVVQKLEILSDISKKALEAAGMPDGNSPLYGAPTFIVVSVKAEMSNDIGIANAACVVDHMHLAAAELGLGSVYIWGCLQPFRKNDELAKVFRLPEGFVPVSGLAVGYPVQADTSERKDEIAISVDYI